MDYLQLALRKSDGKELQDAMIGSPHVHYKQKRMSLLLEFRSNETAEEFSPYMEDGSVQVSAKEAFIHVSDVAPHSRN